MKLLNNSILGLQILNSIKVHKKAEQEVIKIKEEGNDEKEREAIALFIKKWVDSVIELLKMDIQVEGRENIPQGPCVFVSNHQGYADIIAVLKATEGKQVGFIAKEDLQKIPYIKTWILTMRGLYIKRGNPREAIKSLKEGVNLLNRGFSLAIFPEGTRSHKHEMGRFKPGSFKLATMSKVPVVPITLDDSYKVYEENNKLTKGVKISVKIHKSIITENLTKEELNHLPAKVEEIIRESLYIND